ncbi:hypothetical protein AJ78_08524 [Emergomyces pasteurianus Ep9510]|uniref:Uncharacterized protein n=1 Tax=Emergomyces pasteurianus Ep9510 TaxID=1447872 RepID=A0A1J9P2U0_9EURO|nr:hypothetical protein AJ78_08524 [Emergomyces pasteurianus Ep9510]
MANQVSLLTYLQNALPAIPVNPPPNPGRNTTNTAYEASDIHNIGVWHGFNLNALLQSYQNLLVQARLPPDPMPTSPPRAITAENALRSKISEYVFPRVRRALRTGFDQLMAINQMNNLTPVSFDVGECAEVIDAFKPDTAYFAVALPAGTGPNRAPGDHNSRHGFLLTNRELVVFRRVDDSGNLELVPPIPFTSGGTAEQPQMTVLLALWYLGMLAAQGGWHM